MPCLMCKDQGSLIKKQTIFTTVIDDRYVLIVKNVPSLVCYQCGETYYDDVVAAKLEEIVNLYRTAMTEIAVVNYDDKVA